MEKHHTSILYHGIYYVDREALANKLNITVEQLLIEAQQDPGVIIAGHRYDSLNNAAQVLNLPTETLKERLIKYGNNDLHLLEPKKTTSMAINHDRSKSTRVNQCLNIYEYDALKVLKRLNQQRSLSRTLYLIIINALAVGQQELKPFIEDTRQFKTYKKVSLSLNPQEAKRLNRLSRQLTDQQRSPLIKSCVRWAYRKHRKLI